MVQLPAKVRDIIDRYLRALSRDNIPIKEAILFGSYAKYFLYIFNIYLFFQDDYELFYCIRATVWSLTPIMMPIIYLYFVSL